MCKNQTYLFPRRKYGTETNGSDATVVRVYFDMNNSIFIPKGTNFTDYSADTSRFSQFSCQNFHMESIFSGPWQWQ